MCAHMCTRVWVCMCVHRCGCHVHVCRYVRVYMHVEYDCMHVYTCGGMCTCVYTDGVMYVCGGVCTQIVGYVCAHGYVCGYACEHTQMWVLCTRV